MEGKYSEILQKYVDYQEEVSESLKKARQLRIRYEEDRQRSRRESQVNDMSVVQSHRREESSVNPNEKHEIQNVLTEKNENTEQNEKTEQNEQIEQSIHTEKGAEEKKHNEQEVQDVEQHPEHEQLEEQHEEGTNVEQDQPKVVTKYSMKGLNRS
jgi:hypothetical protein